VTHTAELERAPKTLARHPITQPTTRPGAKLMLICPLAESLGLTEVFQSDRSSADHQSVTHDDQGTCVSVSSPLDTESLALTANAGLSESLGPVSAATDQTRTWKRRSYIRHLERFLALWYCRKRIGGFGARMDVMLIARQ